MNKAIDEIRAIKKAMLEALGRLNKLEGIVTANDSKCDPVEDGHHDSEGRLIDNSSDPPAYDGGVKCEP
jgi:hypothetical protein